MLELNDRIQKKKGILKRKAAYIEVAEILDNIFSKYNILDSLGNNNDKLSVWKLVVMKDGILPFKTIKLDSNDNIMLDELKKLFQKYLHGSIINTFYHYSDELVFELVVNKKIFNHSIISYLLKTEITNLFIDDKNNFILLFEDEYILEVFVGKYVGNRIKFLYPS